MSSFICDQCGAEVLDSPDGYTTSCEHFPIECFTVKKEIDFFEIFLQNESICRIQD
jgi:hypothetical protein